MIEYNEKKAVQTEEPDIKPTKLFRRYRPKYLKKPEKRKSLRALTCFALVFAALMTSAVGTYAKYISPTVEIPPLSIQAAQFAFEAKQMTPEETEAYKNEHLTGLNDNQLLACAFTVSNKDVNGNISEVDINCDLTFRCEFVVDMSESYWGDYTLNALKSLMKDELKVYLYVDGEKKTELTNELNMSTVAGDIPYEMPMGDVVSGYDVEMSFPMSFLLRNSDAISLKTGSIAENHTCAIVFDVTGYTPTKTALLRQPKNDPSITVTANQSKGGT